MQIAAAYIRVSTDDQTEYSPTSQIRAIRDYAKRHDLLIPEEHIYIDEGISGRKVEKRPAFLRMISAAKQQPKPFERILVYSLSRFARNREDSVVYKRMLRKDLEIDVVSITQDFGTDKTSILMEALLEAMDEYYSVDLGENVRRGMRERASRGEAVSIPAFGYRIERGKYLPDPETAPLVQNLFHQFADGGRGYRDLAAELNQMGIRTRRKNLWENRDIEYILRNPVYIGKIRWNPNRQTRCNYDDPDIMIVDAAHEPIVDTDVWQRTQDKIRDIKLQYPKYARKERKPTFALQGLVCCSNCGSTLTRLGERYVQCHSYAKGACRVSHCVNIPKLMDMTISGIQKILQTGNFELIQKTAKKTTGKELLQKQLAHEEQKLRRVREAYEAGVDTLEEYRENKAKIAAQIEQLSRMLHQEEKPVDRKAFVEKAKNILAQIMDTHTSQESKNALFRSFVERIIFDRAAETVTVIFYTE